MHSLQAWIEDGARSPGRITGRAPTTLPGGDEGELVWDIDCARLVAAGGSKGCEVDGASIQLSQQDVRPPATLIERLVGALPAAQPHLVVELRTGRDRLRLAAPCDVPDLKRLPHMASAPDAVVELPHLADAVDAWREGGARVAHGAFSGGTLHSDVDVGEPIAYSGTITRTWIPFAVLGASLMAVASWLGVDNGIEAWRIGAGWLFPVVLLSTGVLSQAARRASNGSSRWLGRGTLLLDIGAFVLFGFATLGAWESAALFWVGTLIAFRSFQSWLYGRQMWHQVELDERGIHARRRAAPEVEEIDWTDTEHARRRLIREATRKFGRTTLLEDGLRLVNAKGPEDRAALLEKRRAGEALGPVYPDESSHLLTLSSEDGALVWWLVGVLVGLAAIVGVAHWAGAVDMEHPLESDARVFAAAGIFLWAVVALWRLRVDMIVDREYELLLTRVRQVGAPKTPVYRAHPKVVLDAKPLGGWEPVPSGQSWAVTNVDAGHTFHYFSEQAAAERAAEALNRFQQGGPAPDVEALRRS